MTRFPLHTMLATATTAAILLGVHCVDRTKGFDLASLRPIAEFRFDRASFVPVVPVALPGVSEALAVPDPIGHGMTAAVVANPGNPGNPGNLGNPGSAGPDSEFLFDGTGAMDHFYAALRGLAVGQSGRTVRIVHYGDSPTTADLITGDARDLLQERFGNAGPGFVLVAKPWAWYGHRGVDVSGSGWKIDTAVGSMRDGIYGLGGAMFTGGAGASSSIRLSAHDSTTAEVEYLEEPGGGDIDVSADGVGVGTVKTAGAAKTNGAESVALPVGTRVVGLRVVGGPVQVFGVALGRAGRGITYDSLGLNGASTTVMSRAFDIENWTGALRHRDPDLVIINYGTNESSFPVYVEKQYEPELRRAIARVRTALPEASILVMSPMDRGARMDGDEIETMRAIPEIVAIQRRVAQEMGCGFFNTYAAMGGAGTMARWYDGHPRMVAADLIHPTPQGARIVAELLTGQMLVGYERYVETHPVGRRRPPAAMVAGRFNESEKPRGVQ